MYARVTTAAVQPGRIDDVAKNYRDKTLPMAQKNKGFKGAIVLANREKNKAIVIALWDTEADMKATEASGWYSQRVTDAKASNTFRQTEMEHYEVALQV